MSKNIVRTFAYSEGPYIVTFNEMEDGTLEESREHVVNYSRKTLRKVRREYESQTPLKKYSKYNDQIRTTDVWNMYDN
jgi:hypothetical protein